MVAVPAKGADSATHKMQEWYEVKARAILGREGGGDDHDIVVVGRMVRWAREGVELEAGRNRTGG